MQQNITKTATITIARTTPTAAAAPLAATTSGVTCGPPLMMLARGEAVGVWTSDCVNITLDMTRLVVAIELPLLKMGLILLKMETVKLD